MRARLDGPRQSCAGRTPAISDELTVKTMNTTTVRISVVFVGRKPWTLGKGLHYIATELEGQFEVRFVGGFAQLAECAGFDLPDPLLGHAQFRAHFLERQRFLAAA